MVIEAAKVIPGQEHSSAGPQGRIVHDSIDICDRLVFTLTDTMGRMFTILPRQDQPAYDGHIRKRRRKENSDN